MNPPPSADASEAIAAIARQSSPVLENRARDVARRNVVAERSGTRTSRSPSPTNILDAATTNLGLDSKEALEAAPAIRSLSLRPSQKTPSHPSAQVSAAGDASSIVSKASSILSTKTDEIDVSAATTLARPRHAPGYSINENDSSSSSTSSSTSSTTNDTNENDESSSLPAYVTTSVQPTSTVFTPRKRELHFLSDIFRQDYQSWLNDLNDDSDGDDDDDDDGSLEVSSRGYTEYTGRTNFDERNGSYRLSHEASALSFALTLDFDDFDTDSGDEESVAMLSL